ncbi:MAG: hypothetical protein NTW99_13395 [Chloroflexi bacterium]|nr:hypothetical protein [Chloroflexota bacterium]
MTFRHTKSLTTIGSLLIVLSIACSLLSGINPGVAAAFTGDPDFGVFATHKNGEALVVMTDAENGEVDEVTGAIWFSPEREAVVVRKGNNNLPTEAVIGDFLILFSNYGADSVDIAIIGSDGSTTIARNVKFDPALLPTTTSYAPGNSTAHLAALYIQTGLTLEDVLLSGAGMLHIAACIINSAAAAYTLVFFPIAAAACTSALSIIRAVYTGGDPYSEFTDVLNYAKDALNQAQELEQSQQVQVFLDETPEFNLGSHCPAGFFPSTDGYCYPVSGDGPVLQRDNGCEPGFKPATDGYCYPDNGCEPGFIPATDGRCYPDNGCEPGFIPATDGRCYPDNGCEPGWYPATDGYCYEDNGCAPGWYPATDGYCYEYNGCAPGYYPATDGYCYPG